MSLDKKFSITLVSADSKPFFFSIKKPYLYLCAFLLFLGFFGSVFLSIYSIKMHSEASSAKEKLANLEISYNALADELNINNQEIFYNLNYRLAVNKNGEITVAGKLSAKLDKEPYRLFLIKYGTSRQKIWEKYFGTGNDQSLIAQTYDRRGFFLVLTEYSEQNRRHEITKRNAIYIFDENGKLIKTRIFDKDSDFKWFDMKIDYRGTLYLSGYDRTSFRNRSKKLEVFIRQLKPEGNTDSSGFIILNNASGAFRSLRGLDSLREKYLNFAEPNSLSDDSGGKMP